MGIHPQMLRDNTLVFCDTSLQDKARNYLFNGSPSQGTEWKKGDVVDICVFRDGKYYHPWYEDIEYDRRFLERMVENHNRGAIPHKIHANIDHITLMGAFGWVLKDVGALYIKQVELETPIGMITRNFLYAKTQLTQQGADALNGEKYCYTSAEVSNNYTTFERFSASEVRERVGPGTGIETHELDDGTFLVFYGPALTGFAMTNDPFMPHLTQMFSKNGGPPLDEDLIAVGDKDDLGGFICTKMELDLIEGEIVECNGRSYKVVRHAPTTGDLLHFSNHEVDSSEKFVVSLTDLATGDHLVVGASQIQKRERASKGAVKYTKSSSEKTCSGCSHFGEGGSCDRVFGKIESIGSCDLWDEKTREPESDKTGEEMKFKAVQQATKKFTKASEKLVEARKFSGTIDGEDREQYEDFLAMLEQMESNERELDQVNERLAFTKGQLEDKESTISQLRVDLADQTFTSAKNKMKFSRAELEKAGAPIPMLEEFDAIFSTFPSSSLNQKFTMLDAKGEESDEVDVFGIINRLFSKLPENFKQAVAAPGATEYTLNNHSIDDPEGGGAGGDGGEGGGDDEDEEARKYQARIEKFTARHGRKPLVWEADRLDDDGNVKR